MFVAEYQAALKLVADKKGIEYDALVSKILAAGGPGSSGTKADNVKFHDDKSLYTGHLSYCGSFQIMKVPEPAHDMFGCCHQSHGARSRIPKLKLWRTPSQCTTGVYKNGGPTNVDNGTADLSNITDRSAADVRGVKK